VQNVNNMALIHKVTNTKPGTPLAELISRRSEIISQLAFILYFLPIIVIFFVNSFLSDESNELPPIYTFLFLWYFIAIGLLEVFNRKERSGQIIEFVLCFPVYLSFMVSLFIVKLFRSKEKYPNITKDKLPLYHRKIKIKKIKKKIRKKKWFS
jgi:hypothetical protein